MMSHSCVEGLHQNNANALLHYATIAYCLNFLLERQVTKALGGWGYSSRKGY